MNRSDNNGILFLGLLTIVFPVFKILGIITWSWWWVLSPILIPIGLVVVLIFLVILFSKE